MKGYKVTGKNKIELIDMGSQNLEQNCVKLKLTHSSISQVDQMIYEGKIETNLPITIGRHGVGMVIEAFEGSGYTRGERVVIDPYKVCGTCNNCTEQKSSNCNKMLVSGFSDEGYLRDFCISNIDNLYKLPDHVTDTSALFVEHIATAISVINRLKLSKGQHLVIVGATIDGIILAQVAMYYQIIPLLIDTREELLEIATKLGVYYTINGLTSDPYKKITMTTGGSLAESVAYMAGCSMPFQRVFSYLQSGGKIAIVGWKNVMTEITANISSVMQNQLEIFGINNGCKNISSAINMLANHSVVVDPLISKEILFADVPALLEEQIVAPNRYVKVVVKI